MATFKKGDDETLDYGIDWSDILTDEGVTISSSTWDVPAGLTEESNSSSSTGTSIVVSGGTVGELYTLTNIITTSGTPIFERSINIIIVSNKYK